MTASLAWKHFGAEQINHLEAALDHDQCKTLLKIYLRLGRANIDCERVKDAGGDHVLCGGEDDLTDKENVVLNFHYYNYAFCKERRLNARATSTLLSIFKDVFDEDMQTNDGKSSLRASFDRFQELLLRHAVDRPPWTTAIIPPNDIGAIVDYFLNSYYRHFHLYKYIFATRINVVIEQQHPHGVEEPFSVPPLRGALTLPTRD